MTFLMIGILLSALSVTDIHAQSMDLTFGEVRVEGLLYAEMVQRIHIEVTNNGEEVFHDWWEITDKPEEYDWNSFNFSPIVIEGGETKDIIIDIRCMEAGNHQMYLHNIHMETLPMQPFPLNIKEKGAIKVKTDFQIDMFEKDDEGYFMYLDPTFINIKGTLTLTNEEETSILDRVESTSGAHLTNYQLVAIQQAGEDEFSTSIDNFPSLINPGETVSGDFNLYIDKTPQVGTSYILQLKLFDTVIATSDPFTFKRSTNTYWTADGSNNPLPVIEEETDNKILKVPPEALAVDLRGLYDMDNTFSIDVTQANPNCLYYLGFLDYVPKGFQSETNIVRNGEASDVVIDSNYDYFCPIQFMAKSALFIYTPFSESMGPASPVMTQKMSGFITLPFSTETAWITGTNTPRRVNPFYNDDFKMADFKEYNDGTLVFEALSETTYIWNFRSYLIYDIKPSPIAFFAENCVIFPAPDIPFTSNDFAYQGTGTEAIPTKGTYRWSCDNEGFYRNDGQTPIRPFASWIGKWDNQNSQFEDLGLDVLPYRIELPTPTTIKDISKNQEKQLPVYTLSGQLAGTATNINGHIKAEGLKPGLYVAGGQKIVVK